MEYNADSSETSGAQACKENKDKAYKIFLAQLEKLEDCRKKEEFALWKDFIDSEEFKQCYLDEKCCHEFVRSINRYAIKKKTLEYILKNADETEKSIVEDIAENYYTEDAAARIKYVKAETTQILRHYEDGKRNKIKIFATFTAIIVVLGLLAVKHSYDGKPVEFKDSRLGEALCEAVEDKNVNISNVKYDDLKKVKELVLTTCDYSSLNDIKYCTELKSLKICSDNYKMPGDKCELTDEQVERIGKELNEIIPELHDLEELELGIGAR